MNNIIPKLNNNIFIKYIKINWNNIQNKLLKEVKIMIVRLA